MKRDTNIKEWGWGLELQASSLLDCGDMSPLCSPQNQKQRHVAAIPKAYTLTELLVVIAVIILLLSIAVPGLSKLMNAGKQDSAIGAFSAAVALTRSYAGRNPVFDGPYGYQGVAIIATPANELRIVEHIEESRGPATGGPFLAYSAPPYAGYRDIANEPYVTIPTGVGVVGITRNDPNFVRLVAPPFALRFDPNGHLIVRAAGAQGVVYDGNGDMGWDYNDTRPNMYDPLAWDPETSGKTATNYNANTQKYLLDFENLETVIGVIAYNKKDLQNAGHNLAADSNAAYTGGVNKEAAAWILENGRVLFFNRYSGAVIKP